MFNLNLNLKTEMYRCIMYFFCTKTCLNSHLTYAHFIQDEFLLVLKNHDFILETLNFDVLVM